MQNGRAGRLHPAVGTARRHLVAALEKLLGAGSIKATGRSRTASTAEQRYAERARERQQAFDASGNKSGGSKKKKGSKGGNSAKK